MIHLGTCDAGYSNLYHYYGRNESFCQTSPLTTQVFRDSEKDSRNMINIKYITMLASPESVLLAILCPISIFFAEHLISRPLASLFSRYTRKALTDYPTNEVLSYDKSRKTLHKRDQTPIISKHAVKLSVTSIVILILISNPLNLVPTELLDNIISCCQLSLVWCTLRVFNILYSEPDIRRWKLQHANQLGPGLAWNYWDGYIHNFVMERTNVIQSQKRVAFKHRRDFINIVDVISQFREENSHWIRIPPKLLKLVLLVDFTCNFEKDKKKWPELYKMELREDENENLPKMPLRNPIKTSSKSRDFDIKLARVWNPANTNEYFHIVFDAPQILHSAMGGSKSRVKDPELKRRNVEDFVDYLYKILKTEYVTEQVEIVCFNDELLSDCKSQQLSMYEVISQHLKGAR